jgi:hypothetical protein
MPSLKVLFRIVAIGLIAADISAFGQAPNTDYKILKIEPSFLESPSYSGPRDKRPKEKAKPWLEVDVSFQWQPRLRQPNYTDELIFNYYILLKNKSPQNPKGTLLVGEVTHMGIRQEKEMHSVVYVTGRTLNRFLGKDPNNPEAALEDVGVAITKQGQQVASASWKSKSGNWWPQLPQTPGFVLNKNETPFAPLAWDFYETIKPNYETIKPKEPKEEPKASGQ